MKLISDKNPIDVFKSASKILYNAVAHTLGPSGLNTAVVYGREVQANPKFQIINDGKTIIDNLTSNEAEVACALQTIRESVLSTNSVAGDGTTSTIILTNALLDELSRVDISRFEMCRQLKNLRKDVLNILPSLAQPLNDEVNIAQIAETSLGSSEFVDLFVDAYDFTGADGEVLLEKYNLSVPSVEKIDGMSFNQVGFIPELVLDETGAINKKLNKCKILILKGDITSFSSISNLLLKSKNSEEPIILIYDRMSTDVFRLVAQNIMKGGYNLYPITLEGYGDKIMRYTRLISEIAGNQAIEIKEGLDYNDVKIYGDLAGLVFNKDAIIIKPMQERLALVAKYVKDNDLHMSTKTAIIKSGAANSIALEEQYRRFEDAIYSCTNAIRYGVCLGGGLTYIKVSELLANQGALSKEIKSSILKAMASIYNHLLINCGIEIGVAQYLPRLDEKTGSYILNEDYKIYDSYKTAEQVLINSIDIVCSIFSTKVLICDPQR